MNIVANDLFESAESFARWRRTTNTQSGTGPESWARRLTAKELEEHHEGRGAPTTATQFTLERFQVPFPGTLAEQTDSPVLGSELTEL